MPDYGKFCPVSMGADVIADRWTPLILRELILGSTRFNDIARGLPGISRSLLVQRLKHLERKGVLERWPAPGGRGNEYRLTPAGKDLEGVVFALGEWSVHWLYSDMEPHDIDPITLTWWMHHRVDVAELPPGRVVVQLDYTEPERITTWIVLDRGEASVCNQHPGYDSDVDRHRDRRAHSPTCSTGCSRGTAPSRAVRSASMGRRASPAPCRGGSSAARSRALMERQSKTTVRRP